MSIHSYTADELADRLFALIGKTRHGEKLDVHDRLTIGAAVGELRRRPPTPDGFVLVPQALVEAVAEFNSRVERGEVRSKRTYAKFKAALALLPTPPATGCTTS